MKKGVKSILYIILFLIIILIILAIVFVATFDPNKYKDRISAEVYNKTGRTLTIDGKMSLSFIPWLGLKLNDITLSNPKGFKEPGAKQSMFLSLKHADLHVRLLPLLTKKFVANELVVKGATVNVITLKDGRNNISNEIPGAKQAKQTSKTASKTSTSEPQQETAPAKTEKSAVPFVQVANVNFSDIAVNVNNLRTGQKFSVNNVDFSAKDIGLNKPFSFKQHMNINMNKPQIAGGIDSGGVINIDSDDNQIVVNGFKINTNLKGKGLPDNKLNLKLSSNIYADGERSQLKIDDLNVTSDLIGLQNASMQLSAQSNPTKQQIGNYDGVHLPNSQFQLNIPGLHYKKFQASNVKMQADALSGVVNLKSLTANLYKGVLDANAQADFRGKIPKYTLHESLNGVEAGPLVALMGEQLSSVMKSLRNLPFIGNSLGSHKPVVSGVANLNTSISTQGKETDVLLKALKGSLNFTVSNGMIRGLDLNNWVNLAQKYIQGKTTAANENGDMSFKKLSANFNLNNGMAVAGNNQLSLISDGLTANGDGNADLVRQTLSFAINITSAHNNNFVIPLMITGTFSKPHYSLNTTELIKDQASDQIQNQVNKQLGDKTGKQLAPVIDKLKSIFGN